jgi:hypothetical protein
MQVYSSQVEEFLPCVAGSTELHRLFTAPGLPPLHGEIAVHSSCKLRTNCLKWIFQAIIQSSSVFIDPTPESEQTMSNIFQLPIVKNGVCVLFNPTKVDGIHSLMTGTLNADIRRCLEVLNAERARMQLT